MDAKIFWTIGGSKFHLLVWDDESGEMFWEEDDAFQIGGADGIDSYTCNTRKDKDKEFAAILLVFCLVALHVVLVNQYFAL